jgi:hypothetical protein
MAGERDGRTALGATYVDLRAHLRGGAVRTHRVVESRHGRGKVVLIVEG